MQAAMTVNDFNAFLTREQHENSLLDILHKLTKIERPEDVLVAAKEPPDGRNDGWPMLGWRF
jgi:hypothetical protein